MHSTSWRSRSSWAPGCGSPKARSATLVGRHREIRLIDEQIDFVPVAQLGKLFLGPVEPLVNLPGFVPQELRLELGVQNHGTACVGRDGRAQFDRRENDGVLVGVPPDGSRQLLQMILVGPERMQIQPGNLQDMEEEENRQEHDAGIPQRSPREDRECPRHNGRVANVSRSRHIGLRCVRTSHQPYQRHQPDRSPEHRHGD